MDFSGRHVHLVGIGGAGLSAIARVLLERGSEISGSDLVLSPAAAALAEDGVQVYVGHSADQVAGADLAIVSSAVPDDSVEVEAARAAGIPIMHRSEVLGEMMADQIGVAVSGTHGKTTTTAMIASVLWEGGLDPTFIVGGQVTGLGTNARAGSGPHFVIEADEYDRTFLGLRPQVAVILNVDHDHPDCYPTLEEYHAAFAEFTAKVPADGLLVVCRDHPVARALGEERAEQGLPVAFYGLEEGAVWRAEEIRPNFAGGLDFLAMHEDQVLGLARLRVPGKHNVSNAMAVLAVADYLGVPFPTVRSALASFRGVGRRFELKGEVDGVTVVDDYAHHPAEIEATLSAAREQYPERDLWVVWQPHTYSRTSLLLDEFASAFGYADRLLVLPIYAAREIDNLGVASADVVAAMDHPDVQLADSLEDAVVTLGTEVRAGDVVLTLGAGDSDMVGEWLLIALGGDNGLKRDLVYSRNEDEMFTWN